MGNWCKVEDGKVIDGPQGLPKNTKQVSGFNLLPQEDLAKWGWFPVVELLDELKPDQEYGPHALEYDEKGAAVILTRPVRPKPPPEPVPYADARKRAYPPTDELVVALWERVVEGRSEASNALQEARAAVKAKYPKMQ